VTHDHVGRVGIGPEGVAPPIRAGLKLEKEMPVQNLVSFPLASPPLSPLLSLLFLLCLFLGVPGGARSTNGFFSGAFWNDHALHGSVIADVLDNQTKTFWNKQEFRHFGTVGSLTLTLTQLSWRTNWI